MTLIGDVITLIYNFLGGELSARFVLKILTVAVIAGGVVAYYLADIRGEDREPQT
jgi:membrane protein YqaA with SNARE-associated domain